MPRIIGRREGAGGIDAKTIRWRLRGRVAEGRAVMSSRRVLILEDSLIIAMEVEEILRATGVETVEIAANLEQAMNAIDNQHYDFALLDVNLGEAMSFGFARLLTERGIPYGFVSGYSDTQDFPDDLRHVPLLVKPFDEAAMREFIEKLRSSA
jgi:CheY-like chemotaxis protein